MKKPNTLKEQKEKIKKQYDELMVELGQIREQTINPVYGAAKPLIVEIYRELIGKIPADRLPKEMLDLYYRQIDKELGLNRDSEDWFKKTEDEKNVYRKLRLEKATEISKDLDKVAADLGEWALTNVSVPYSERTYGYSDKDVTDCRTYAKSFEDISERFKRVYIENGKNAQAIVLQGINEYRDYVNEKLNRGLQNPGSWYFPLNTGPGYHVSDVFSRAVIAEKRKIMKEAKEERKKNNPMDILEKARKTKEYKQVIGLGFIEEGTLRTDLNGSIHFNSLIFNIEYKLFASGNLTAQSNNQRQASIIALIKPSINNRVMDVKDYQNGFQLIEQNINKRLQNVDIPKSLAEYAVNYKLA